MTEELRAKKNRGCGFKLLVLVGTLFSLLFLLEVGARVYARLNHKQRGMGFDPVIGYRMKPGVVKEGSQWSANEPAWTNALGWRDAETTYAKPEGVRRIVALGDSFTFGMGVDYGERFTELLEGDHPDLEVLNLGVNGFGTDQACLLLEEEGLSFDPDLVLLVVFVGNDLDDIRYTRNGHWPKPHFLLRDGQLVLVPPERTWDVRLRLTSYLGEGLFGLWKPRMPDRVRAPQWKEADTIPLFRAILARMQARCREAGVPLLVLFGYHPHRAATGAWPAEVRALESVRELGIPVIDSLPAVSAAEIPDALYLPNIHWSALGNRLIADLIGERIEALGLFAD